MAAQDVQKNQLRELRHCKFRIDAPSTIFPDKLVDEPLQCFRLSAAC